MNRPAIAAVAAVLLLTLTGCAEPAGNASDERVAPASATEEATETPAPLEAIPSDASSEEEESDYLVTVRDRLAKIRSQIPDASDEQLLAAGHEACDRLTAGESGEIMTLIEGEQLTNGYYMDSGAIVIAARLTMCPIE